LDFISKEIREYSEQHTSPASALLNQIDRETNVHVLNPRMLSGHMQGRILSTFSQMIRPKRILEIGTYTGYSALCMAEGLASDGLLITIDVNEELEERVRAYFSKSSFDQQIDYRIGDAVSLIPTIQDTFDLVFIDADKINYQNYFDLVIGKMNKGGFIIADNVLWSGKVTEPVKSGDLETKILIEFNQKVQDDPRVENVLFPLRDGLMVIRVI